MTRSIGRAAVYLLACSAWVWAPSAAAGQATDPVTVASDAFLALRVVDVDAASEWYAGVFDLEEVRRFERAGLSIRLLQRGGLRVELIEQGGTSEPPDRHLGLFKIGLYVEEIGPIHADLVARGLDVDDAVLTDDAFGVQTFVLRDPWGNRIQIFEVCAGACGR